MLNAEDGIPYKAAVITCATVCVGYFYFYFSAISMWCFFAREQVPFFQQIPLFVVLPICLLARKLHT